MNRTLPIFVLALLPLSCLALEREAWTTSKIQGSPEPPLPYVTEVIWPHITFSEGLDITLLESEERLFVTERRGKIWSLPADLSTVNPEPKLCGDILKKVPDLVALYGLTFHPKFHENRQLYLFYVVGASDDNSTSRVSKFLMDKDLQLIPESEEIIITLGGGGHNGGDIHFGPDGMFYFTAGDFAAPSPPDPKNAGQDLSNLASTIVRIDLDRRDPGLAYHIPKDNPFINVPGARPEIWAYGLRNPWKMCFHPTSGDIWLGDVGWEVWEMVYRIEKGGNYGWSFMEGPTVLKQNSPQGPTSILPPVAYYSHTDGASITGGYFGSGPRLPDLKNAYIYGDYITGRVWALDWDGKRVTRNRLIADTRKQIVTFGQDLKGDLIFLNYPDNGQLYRLVPNPDTRTSTDFPTLLSKTGLFQNVKSEAVSAGVYHFSIKAPTWQDGLESRYWIALPGKGRIQADVRQRDNLPLLSYRKPNDTVLAKTIHANGKRIETQILHFDGYWNGYSYRWNDEQTDATLVGKDGLETTVMGKPYRFPARGECVRCHGSNFHRPLAFIPGQLNRDNQLHDFLELGLIDQKFADFATIQSMDNPSDTSATLDQRARSWIQTNCAHCHRVSGGAGVTAQFNRSVPNDRMRLLETSPEKGYFGLENGHLIEPGNPYRSIFYYRTATKGAGHMPMIGPKTIDKAGVELIHDWIRSLNPNAPLAKPTSMPANVEEALALYHRIQSGALSKQESEKAIAACMRSTDPFVINLFAGLTLD
jgi:glucose/arabinose dehydrogenase/mono/diheme cytochrome c family protein